MNSIYFDTETDGLYGPVVLAQWKDSNGKIHIKHIENEEDEEEIRQLLREADNVIGHNLLYDFSCLNINPDELKSWDDTYLLAKLAYPDMESWSLDEVAKRTLGFDVYEGIDKKAMQKAKWKRGLDIAPEQLIYAKLDVAYLDEIFAKLESYKQEFNYTLDKLTAKNFWKAKSGLPVDRMAMMNRLNENNQKIQGLNVPINVNSWRQVRDYLEYDESNDEALAYLIAKGSKEQQEKAKKVREVRKLRKQNSFIEKYLKLSEQDGYIYGHLGLAPKSGRSNCQNENLQQIPGSLKDCFAHPSKYMVYADFSNLELRTFCAIVGERTMERLLRDDVDLHTYTATRLFDKPAEEIDRKTERQIAKIFNFSSLYGAGVERRRQILLKLVGIWLELDEAKLYAQRWSQAFPQVKQWHQENAKKWRAGYIEYTILGRPYKAKLLTDYNNIQISGSAAEVAKLALHYMSKKIPIENMNIFIHDSYTFEFDTLEEAKEAAKVIGDSMQEAWFEVMQYSKIPDLPMPVEVTVGEPRLNWFKLQEGIDCIYTYKKD